MRNGRHVVGLLMSTKRIPYFRSFLTSILKFKHFSVIILLDLILCLIKIFSTMSKLLEKNIYYIQ